MSRGRVYLIGAGPGDPRLITWRGLEYLRAAEVVIYDRLIDNSLLDEAPAQAERIYVGKIPGQRTLSQEEINGLLVCRALQGKSVVRLKGGDPFVFGRGGEEAEALAKAGVPFAIVPGVTSAIAAPAYAGIPVTHREFASSFTVITGHEDVLRDASRINWKRITTGADTLVFMMAVTNLPFVVSQLLANGCKPDTPAAIVANGTRPDQVTLTTTLDKIVDLASAHKIRPPAVLVVGDVVMLRQKLAWFDKRPLFGRRVLVTRAKTQASVLRSLLNEVGAEVIEYPVIEIKEASHHEMDQAIDGIGRFDWVLFTSVNGVRAFFRRLSSKHLDCRAFYRAKIGAIGPATAGALREMGIVPDFIPSVYTTEQMFSEIGERNVSGKDVLLVRADIADQRLTAGLKRMGANVREVVAYHTVPVKEDPSGLERLLSNNEIDVVTFTSASTVHSLVGILGGNAELLEKTLVACIGPATATAARRASIKVDIVAAEHTTRGMTQAIVNYYREHGK